MKHNMKAHLSLALAAALALSLTACGPKDSDGSGSSGSGSMSSSQSQSDVSGGASSQKEDPTPAPDPDPTPAPNPEPLPGPAQESLDAIRQEMEPSGAIAAVFFLGIHEGEPLDETFYTAPDRAGYFEGRSFMKEIPLDRYVSTDGMEVYCIVPADPKASVVVTEWDEAGEKPVEGKVLYEGSTGEPLFVQGNVSDIMPNLSITVVDSHGNVLDKYHPHISMKDGSVALPDGDQIVLDMTGSMAPVDPYGN